MPPPHRAGAGDASAFFAATLVLWAVSVGFEIGARGRRELAAVAAGFAFFQAANTAVRAAVSRDPLFVNTAVSLLHSSLTSASVIFVLFCRWRAKGLENMFEHEELVGRSWLGAYSALCFSCGYFAYDQLDMLRYRLYSGWIPGILMHHLILLICFTLALYRNVTINYLILTLLCEMHSIFLHVRKLRRMAGFRDFSRKMVKLEWILNWTTFLTATRPGLLLAILRSWPPPAADSASPRYHLPILARLAASPLKRARPRGNPSHGSGSLLRPWWSPVPAIAPSAAPPRRLLVEGRDPYIDYPDADDHLLVPCVDLLGVVMVVWYCDAAVVPADAFTSTPTLTPAGRQWLQPRRLGPLPRDLAVVVLGVGCGGHDGTYAAATSTSPRRR